MKILNSVNVLQAFVIWGIRKGSYTIFGFIKHYRRIFTARDVRDLMEDREQVAADLLMMKQVVANLLTQYRNNPSLDIQVVMTDLERLMNEVEF